MSASRAEFVCLESDLHCMYADEEMVMLSALQHAVFCMRQCALIHLDGTWTENSLTAAGRVLHERVDRREHETRRDVRLATALRLISHRLGVAGVADMVEFHRVEEMELEGVSIRGASGKWIPFPVEYKRGKPKIHRADEVQLCAQAMCLEEMLNVEIPSGALFYGEMRRRVEVRFDSELRALTEDTAEKVHHLFSSRTIPPAEYGKWCESCSLLDSCNPKVRGKSARAWLLHQVEEACS